MDHSHAVEQMAAERYLLNELTPEAREAFEEHFFDCPDCALDLRAAAAFIDEAKVQLPTLSKPAAVPAGAIRVNTPRRPGFWSTIWKPAFALPAFAALLLVVGYQNFVTLPGLRAQTAHPHLLTFAPLHGATRGGARAAFTTDREHGLALPLDLTPQPGTAAFASYSVNLLDGQGKTVWTGNLPAPAESGDGSQRVLLALPGAMLRSGSYSVSVAGVDAQGQTVPLDKYAFDLSLSN
jgi:hypothetical protein